MALLMASIACGATGAGAEKAATDVADLFLLALKKGTWTTAYNRLDPSLQQACGGDPHALARHAIARFESRLTDWELQIESAYRDNVVLGGEVRRDGKAPVTVGIVADNDGEQWRISVFEVDGTDLCRPATATDQHRSEEEAR